MNLLSITRISNVESEPPSQHWLVEKLWAYNAVGFVGGQPKSFKTWMALELAVAVASGQPCLGRYAVHKRGPVLYYAAEDSPSAMKARARGIAKARGIPFESLALGLITEPVLRLDDPACCARIDATLEKVPARLLILDPMVRLHAGDENSSSEVSAMLSFLREMQRKHNIAIALVHHVRKNGASHLGQALRGSGDLHAWTDSALYIVRRKGNVVMQAEHRSRRSPSAVTLELADSPAHLEVVADEETDRPEELLDARVVDMLGQQTEPRSRARLRELLRVRNESLGHSLQRLEAAGRIVCTDGRWAVPGFHSLREAHHGNG